jgi:peptidyl-tRNA hydrolase
LKSLQKAFLHLFQTKIALKIIGKEAVQELHAQAEAKGLVASIVRDAGKLKLSWKAHQKLSAL